jgi:hypothetical protein
LGEGWERWRGLAVRQPTEHVNFLGRKTQTVFYMSLVLEDKSLPVQECDFLPQNYACWHKCSHIHAYDKSKWLQIEHIPYIDTHTHTHTPTHTHTYGKVIHV